MGTARAAATTSGNATLSTAAAYHRRERGRARGDPEHGEGRERRADRRGPAGPVPHGGHQEPGDDRRGVAEHHLVDVPHRAGEIRRRADQPGVLRDPQRHARRRENRREQVERPETQVPQREADGALADGRGRRHRRSSGNGNDPRARRVPPAAFTAPAATLRRRAPRPRRGAPGQHLDVLLERALLHARGEQFGDLASTASNGSLPARDPALDRDDVKAVARGDERGQHADGRRAEDRLVEFRHHLAAARTGRGCRRAGPTGNSTVRARARRIAPARLELRQRALGLVAQRHHRRARRDREQDVARLDQLAGGEPLGMRVVVAAAFVLRRRRGPDVGLEHLRDDALLRLAVANGPSARASSWHEPELARPLQQQLADRERAPRRGVGIGRIGVQRRLARDRLGGNVVPLTVIVIVALLVVV